MRTDSWKQGWRLWSPRSYTDAVDTRTGDRVVLKVHDRAKGRVLDRFGPNVGQPDPSPPIHDDHRDLPDLASGLRLGCWSQDGCYELELKRPEVHLKLTIADSRSLACGPSDDPVLRKGVWLCHVECLHLADNVDAFFEVHAAAPVRLAALEGDSHVVDRRIMITPGASALSVHRLPGEMNPQKALKRVRQLRSYVRHFGGAQLSGPQRMGHAVRWNICHDVDRQDVYLAVNRSWVEMMARNTGLHELGERGPLIFGWDSVLSAILVARSEPILAREILRSVIARQQPDGRLPFVSLGPYDGDRTAPPLLPLAAWYLCHDGDWEFAAEVLPALVSAHRWLMKHRHPHNDGLLCWGDDEQKEGPLRVDGRVGAAYESGMDNSPMWEDLDYDESTRSLGRGCVDLCSMAALSARILVVLTQQVGEDPSPFVNDYLRIHHAVNTHLWGPDQLYHNMNLDGSLSSSISPTSFYPMMAGLCSPDQARALVWRHLRDNERFWGHPVIPSVPRNSPHYNGAGDYWRGRIWPPINYLVWAGLRQYDPAEAAHLAEHSRILFEQEWARHGHVHENYSAETAQGEPHRGNYARSCHMYCWGGLLLLPDVESKVGGAVARLPQISLE